LKNRLCILHGAGSAAVDQVTANVDLAHVQEKLMAAISDEPHP
jgi:hypothetical protein